MRYPNVKFGNVSNLMQIVNNTWMCDVESTCSLLGCWLRFSSSSTLISLFLISVGQPEQGKSWTEKFPDRNFVNHLKSTTNTSPVWINWNRRETIHYINSYATDYFKECDSAVENQKSSGVTSWLIGITHTLSDKKQCELNLLSRGYFEIVYFSVWQFEWQGKLSN